VRDFVRALRAVHAPEHQALEDHEALPAGAFDWRALAAVAAPYLRPAPGASCLLGPLDAAPKARHPLWEMPRSARLPAAPGAGRLFGLPEAAPQARTFSRRAILYL